MESAANDAVLSRRATLSAMSCSIFLPSRRDCADKASVHVRFQSACASRTQSTNLWSRICETCELTIYSIDMMFFFLNFFEAKTRVAQFFLFLQGLQQVFSNRFYQ
jgi:hypothetical protein